MPNQRDVQEWLDKGETIVALDTKQQSALEAIVGSDGLLVLLGLMMATRQGFFIQLSNLPLTSEASRYQAAVIQGQIKAIDLLPQTILEQFPSAGN